MSSTTAYFVNPKSWLKIMTLPQGTLHRNLSEVQELLHESLDLNGFKSEVLKPNPKHMISMDSLPWLCESFNQAFNRQSMPRSCAVLHTLNFTGKKKRKKKKKKSLKQASLAALPVAKQCLSFWFHLLSNFSSQSAWNRKKRRLRGLVFLLLHLFLAKQWRSGWPENFKESLYLCILPTA